MSQKLEIIRIAVEFLITKTSKRMNKMLLRKIFHFHPRNILFFFFKEGVENRNRSARCTTLSTPSKTNDANEVITSPARTPMMTLSPV